MYILQCLVSSFNLLFSNCNDCIVSFCNIQRSSIYPFNPSSSMLFINDLLFIPMTVLSVLNILCNIVFKSSISQTVIDPAHSKWKLISSFSNTRNNNANNDPLHEDAAAMLGVDGEIPGNNQLLVGFRQHLDAFWYGSHLQFSGGS